DDLLAALDRLTQFVTQGPRDRPRGDYLELVRLDQEVCTLCWVAGLALPPVTYEGYYGDHQVGFCRVPVTRSSRGCHIWLDGGWSLAMQGLRRTAELARAQCLGGGATPVAESAASSPRLPVRPGHGEPGAPQGQGATVESEQLWARDPVQAFECLRDR